MFRRDRHSAWLIDAPCGNEINLCLAIGTEILEETQTASTKTPDYLSWLSARLLGRTRSDNHWIDDQTLEQVLAASEMLGAIFEHGHRVVVLKLSPGQTEEATDIGFSIYSEGPEAVSEALVTIRKTPPALWHTTGSSMIG
ncbi:MAG: hypothetical protein ABJQ70_09320 [Roseobacter sp.]